MKFNRNPGHLGMIIGTAEEAYSEMDGIQSETDGIYTPSSFFWRHEIRATAAVKDVRRLEELALLAVRELEALRAWVAKQGAIPPEFFVLHTERIARNVDTEKEDRDGYHSWLHKPRDVS